MNVEILPLDPDGFLATLDGWESRALRIEEAYGALVEDFHEIERRRFAEEGPGWLPLNPSTQEERGRLGYGPGHPILRRTDNLYDSLTDSDAPGAVYREEIDGFFIGSNVYYAQYHQVGGYVDGRPPKRQLVELGAADRVRWYAILGKFLAFGSLDGVEMSVTSDLGPGN